MPCSTGALLSSISVVVRTGRLEGRCMLPEPIGSTGILAISRGLDVTRNSAVAAALRDAGIRAVEVTLDSPDALRAISMLAEAAGPDDLVGAGTVMDVVAARQAVDAGAQLLVTPHTDAALIRWAVDREVPILPGVFTATDVAQARGAGASAVKWFPATAGGPAALSALRGPFPGIPFVPTGGVTGDDIHAYMAAGAAALALGGWLIGEGRPADVASRARLALEQVEKYRS